MSPMKLLLSIVLAAFAASLLSGCGQQEESSEPQVASTHEEAEADADGPQHERHELMEDVRDGAEVVGPMLKGDAEFDAVAAMQTLETWKEVGDKFGDLFPEGSEGGEAAPAIWEDRAGFDAALAEWQEATTAAIAANPQTLEDARASIGPIFNTCKNCHDSYRIEEEEEE